MRRIWIALMACLFIFPPFLVSAAPVSPVKTEMNYCIIRPFQDGVEVVSMVSFRNTGTEQLKADADGHVLTLHLPIGAEHIMLFDEKDKSVIVDKETIYTTKPIQAGQIIDLPYSFRLAGTGTGKLTLPFNYPSDEVHVLIPDKRGDINIENAGNSQKSTFSFNGQDYIGYTLKDQQARQPITISYSMATNPEGEKEHITTPTEQSAWLRMYEQTPLRTIPPRIFVAIAASLIVMSLIFAFSKWQKKRKATHHTEEEFYEQGLLDKQSILMDKIIELEKSYQENKISEDEFTKRREAYKQVLVQLKQSLREQADTPSTGQKML
ncbi:hypothetical protein ACQCN2_10810 [Brevibacillus ginsengisoli]|uniref:hypothetical protein n=1 Tax=Brevibacillus ginsengisoli TaxID=363854 RepID=UPI003CEE32F1